jgi:Mn2+/Fe2+ NRAMP family transporter
MGNVASAGTSPNREADAEKLEENLMMKYVIGAGLLVALAVPSLATSTTTTTTGGASTTTEQYYVVRDPSTKRCTVTASKPTGGTTVVVGDTVYKTRSEAEAAVTKVCTN